MAEGAHRTGLGRRTLSRLGLTLIVLALAESLVRVLAAPPASPPFGDMLAEFTARCGRLTVLVLPVVVLGALIALMPSLVRRLRHVAAHLSRPVVVLRAALVLAVATVGARYAIGTGYDFVWHVGWVFGSAGFAGWIFLESLIGLRQKPNEVSVAGRLGLLSILSFLCLGHLGRLDTAWISSIGLVIAFVGLIPAPKMSWVIVATVSLVPIAGLLIEAESPELRRYAGQHTPVSNLGLGWLLSATDFDGDGSSGWLGLDCDDADPERFPGAVDLPDDGIDQNCLGGDSSLSEAIARTQPGGPRVATTGQPWGVLANHPSDILLLTIDALRADSFTALMPRTIEAVESCAVFKDARAQAPFTDLSLVSLQTGMHPRHLLGDSGIALTPADPAAGRPSIPPTLASGLGIALGYDTHALLSIAPVREFWTEGYANVEQYAETMSSIRPAEEVLRETQHLLDETQDDDRPTLIWTHLGDAHAPYHGGATRGGYDAVLGELDAIVADFLDTLPRDQIVVIAADHGESFGEHGYYAHGARAYDDELAVPLTVCLPSATGGAWHQAEVEQAVGLIDIVPTLFEAVGAPVFYPFHGESLLGVIRGDAELNSPWVYAETVRPYAAQQALVFGCHKWLRDTHWEWEGVFDLCAHPSEELLFDDAEALTALRDLAARIVDHDLDAFRSWRFDAPE